MMFSLKEGEALEKLLQAWKGVSSREIQEVHDCDNNRFWAKDYFDRMIRDEVTPNQSQRTQGTATFLSPKLLLVGDKNVAVPWTVLILTLALILTSHAKPNLLLIASKDNGPELGYYGDPYAQTFFTGASWRSESS